MAIWNKPSFKIASSSTASLTDLTSYVRSLAINQGAEENTATASGDDTMRSAAGLKTWGMSVAFNQSSTGVDAVINPLLGGNCYVSVRRNSTGSIAASNPEWTGTGVITEYTPHEGDMGAQDTATITIANAGDLTRAIST